MELSAATVLERMRVFPGERKTPREDTSGGAVAAPGRERWLAPDKAKHLGVSFVASLGLAVWLRDRGMAESDCAGWAGSAVFSLGVFKEVALDRHHPPSKASWQDVAANLVGVACAGLVWTWVREP